MTRQLIALRSAAVALAITALAACTVGPDYKRPDAPVPATYKELDGWKPAQPRNAASDLAWWSVYGDPVLDGLERQIEVNNQNLKESEAAFRQASAVVAQARAGFYPTVTLDASAQRTRPSTGSVTAVSPRIRNTFDTSAGISSWEIDLWGRIRRTVESDVAAAQASAADIASARLSLQGQLAAAYFQLRVTDAVKQILDESVEAFQRSLEITQNRYNVGIAARTDIASAQTQLENTRSQAVGLGVQRAQLEHSIAALIGRPPADFTLQPASLALDVPVVPVGLPSTLLERRPDVASAERLMASANADIGVAEAAYFPTITLSASYGFISTATDTLFRTASRTWALGAGASQTVFDAGLRGARVEEARAVYDQRVAQYRQAVLTAFQQVEDNLAALRVLEQQADVQAGALRAAREAEALTLNQYRAGTQAYTAVIIAQANALSAQQTTLSILQSRLVASVALIQAIGGGWDAGQLPPPSMLGAR
ncbi:MAG TPA: efflux transporter outer membrane subunit [Alphaproteobacteria bacterium]|jgi:NodT family efflux transporter outer membrane factor (OMF) lipoprotein|nr:efflux transporter outer membrane subunit [Alphaproteobacteria bacterium]